MRPGQRGTKRLLARYGDQLVRVRYRYDERTGRSFKTVELIVEEGPQPRPAPPAGNRRVGVRVEWREAEIRKAVKGAGGTWNPRERAWELRYGRVVELGLEDRIVRDPCL